MLNKHHTKIVKLISNSYKIEDRIYIVQKYVDRFNKSSENNYMSFYNN